MAAKAIAQMEWGRLDAETTANVGVIEGGQAMNVVPDRVKLVGEFRSFDPARVQALRERWQAICEQVARDSEGSVEVQFSQTFEAVRLPEDAPIVRAAVAGLKTVGVEAKLERTGGGSDANAFALKGIQCLVFPTGADQDSLAPRAAAAAQLPSVRRGRAADGAAVGANASARARYTCARSHSVVRSISRRSASGCVKVWSAPSMRWNSNRCALVKARS
jgi:metal-dependent amidase/aminoacylase/carboxypeptidase family protein